jgi:hypothetical protein
LLRYLKKIFYNSVAELRMNTMYWQVITSTLPWYGIRLTK